jgi:hypothetical protein
MPALQAHGNPLTNIIRNAQYAYPRGPPGGTLLVGFQDGVLIASEHFHSRVSGQTIAEILFAMNTGK